MDFNLSPEHLALQGKAREFVEQELFPHELECEENNGISRETHQKIIDATMAWGFNAPNHSKEDGGQGFSIFEQTLLNEELGKATGAIWDALGIPRIRCDLPRPHKKLNT